MQGCKLSAMLSPLSWSRRLCADRQSVRLQGGSRYRHFMGVVPRDETCIRSRHSDYSSNSSSKVRPSNPRTDVSRLMELCFCSAPRSGVKVWGQRKLCSAAVQNMHHLVMPSYICDIAPEIHASSRSLCSISS